LVMVLGSVSTISLRDLSISELVVRMRKNPRNVL
jgi:hypothetical protein